MNLLLIIGRQFEIIDCRSAGSSSSASTAITSSATTSSASTVLRHPGLVFFSVMLTEGRVLVLSICLDHGIMAVWAGDVPVFVLITVRATAAKTLDGAAFIWGFCATRWGPVIALILGERTLGLAGVSSDVDGQC